MRDVRLANGDIAVDPAGRFEVIDGLDAAFQRAMIRISAVKGAFIYDRELGVPDEVSASGDLKERTEQLFNGELARYDGASATVLSAGNGITVLLTVDGVGRTEEVINYGELQ